MNCFLVLRKSDLDDEFIHGWRPLGAFIREQSALNLIEQEYKKDILKLHSDILLSLIDYKIEKILWNGDC